MMLKLSQVSNENIGKAVVYNPKTNSVQKFKLESFLPPEHGLKAKDWTTETPEKQEGTNQG